MSLHIFANIATPFGTAANNRGENDGNITTLQKLVWHGTTHTTVSAEAIRFALRGVLYEQRPSELNRYFDEVLRENVWRDPQFEKSLPVEVAKYELEVLRGEFEKKSKQKAKKGDDDAKAKKKAEDGGALANRIKDAESLLAKVVAHQASNDPSWLDDDLLGYMRAESGAKEGDSPYSVTRRSPLEISRAVSLTPWSGEVVFNAASPRATPSAAKKSADNPVPYGAEIHATRYQFGLALTPERLRDPARAAIALKALVSLRKVAGNHGRFLFDFSPDSIVLRITDDPAPRLLYCFETADGGKTITAPDLVRRVKAGDILPGELVIGGPIASDPAIRELGIPEKQLLPGVRAAADAAIQLIP